MKNSRKSTYKKVVVRRLDQGLVKGFVDSTSFLRPDGVEILEREGRTVTIPLQEVKGVFFVKEFEGNPQRSERKLFHSRPRMAGLWVRMNFKDRETLEGLLPNNLLELGPQGFLLVPADLYSNNLKVFVPRTALTELTVLGVISDGRLRKLPPGGRGLGRETTTAEQIGLFPGAEEEGKKQSK